MVPGDTVRVRKAARFVIVEFGSESEGDDEGDGTGWMASLMPLRSDLLRGDLRCLYLGWLRCAQDGGLDEDELEPPVPAGLEELSGPLHARIEFLEIDEDLVEVAAQASNRLPLDLAAKSCLHGFEACLKRTRTSYSLLRGWSRVNSGEAISCGVFSVKTLNTLLRRLQRPGAVQLISWPWPTRERRKESSR